jgi:hypothetical protein
VGGQAKLMAKQGRPELFQPVELKTAASGWPGSLVRAIEEDGGGVWQTGDHYVEPDRIIERVREVRTRGLRLDARDLSFLERLPELRFLWLATDGRPVLDPLASLTELEALLVHAAGMRGTFDPFALARLRWLRISLGGAVGRTIADRLAAGHQGLEWLSVTEVPHRSIAEVVGAFPSLRHVRLHFADHLHRPGDLTPVAATLRGLELDITGLRSLDGLEALHALEVLSLVPVPEGSLETVAAMHSIRYANLLRRDLSIEPLRGHPGLRMISLTDVTPKTISVLETMPNLIAVGGAPAGASMAWADLRAHEEARAEWFGAIRG